MGMTASIWWVGDAGVPAVAAPGSPGVMATPSLVSAENFQNAAEVTPTFVPTLAPYSPTVTGYVGAAGQTYTADPQWNGVDCNGLLVSYDAQDTVPSAPQVDPCLQDGWNRVQRLARALGNWENNAAYPYPITAPTQEANVAVTSYTQGSTGPGVMLATVATSGIIPGHDYTSTLDLAQMNCWAGNPAELEIELTNPDLSGGFVFAEVIENCDPPITEFDSIGMGTFVGRQSVRATATSLSMRVENLNPGGSGNDAAFDNVGLLDVTAQLDQSIAAGPLDGAWAVGTVAPMTLTITNTHLAGFPNVPSGPRTGMTFRAGLPPGLHLAGATATDCGNGAVTESSPGVLEGTADLAGLVASCTFSLGVTSADPGTFALPAGGYQLLGLLAPADATVTFAATLAPTGAPAVALPLTFAIVFGIVGGALLVLHRPRRGA